MTVRKANIHESFESFLIQNLNYMSYTKRYSSAILFFTR